MVQASCFVKEPDSPVAIGTVGNTGVMCTNCMLLNTRVQTSNKDKYVLRLDCAKHMFQLSAFLIFVQTVGKHIFMACCMFSAPDCLVVVNISRSAFLLQYSAGECNTVICFPFRLRYQK